MPVTLAADRKAAAIPVHLVTRTGLQDIAIDAKARQWCVTNDFKAEAGSLLVVPDAGGRAQCALFGIAEPDDPDAAPLAAGALARKLPAGRWRLASGGSDLAVLGMVLGGYAFTRYGAKATPEIVLETGENGETAAVEREAGGVFLARDLINTPAGDMGPDQLELAVRELATRHAAEVTVVAGEDLLEKNFPMIHAVGRAAAQAPRLIDMRWGRADAPKVTLVGKGVCFDTGGLDIKPASGMLLMKKDMGGAANVLGLASIVMASGLNVRLRVLVPAVENAISGNAFRPGDVLTSRKGDTVEIGNTDAEGRLVLADALALADEEEPQLLVDMATLTGAARVALGPDVPPFFTDDDGLAAELATASTAVADPLWRLPLWRPYAKKLSSRIADVNNVTTDGFAGAVTAALFLRRFVRRSTPWAHFDVYGWNPQERPWCTVGGEAQGIRALARVIAGRFG